MSNQRTLSITLEEEIDSEIDEIEISKRILYTSTRDIVALEAVPIEPHKLTIEKVHASETKQAATRSENDTCKQIQKILQGPKLPAIQLTDEQRAYFSALPFCLKCRCNHA